MIVYRVGNYLDDNLDQFYVFLLLSDGVLRLADVLQSENLFFLLNFSSSPCLLDRRAVLLTSLMSSRHLVAVVLSSFLMCSMEDHRVPVITEFLLVGHVWTDVMFGQMS